MTAETIHARILTYLQSKVKHDIPIDQASCALIDGLILQGYTEADMLRVVEKKAKDWVGTKFEVYLRPQTLFGVKFTKYIMYERRNHAGRVEKLFAAVQGAKRTTWRLDNKRHTGTD